VNRGGLLVLGLGASLGWSMFAAYGRVPERPAPWRLDSLAQRVETLPEMTGVLEDCEGHVLAQPVLAREAGRIRWVVERPFGQPLGVAGLGRTEVLRFGIQGSLSGASRTGGVSLRAYEASGRWARLLVGDPALTAPVMTPLRLTLCADLTAAIYEILGRRGLKASAVVLNARSGAVVAAADFPGPDVNSSLLPNARTSLDSIYAENLPASTMKVLSAAYVLQRRQADAQRAHDCSGHRCWARHGRVSGVRDAVIRSCNTWFRLESRRWNRGDWLQFVMSTGLQPADAPGLPLSPILFHGHTPRQMHWPQAIGQQVWVSLVGLAGAYATLTSKDGRRVDAFTVSPHGAGPAVVTPAVAEQLRQTLRATARGGTAGILNRVYRKGDAGGKTGTGERDGAVSDASFVAVVPWHEPDWIVAVSLKAGGRGTVAGEVAGEILSLLAMRPVKG
jgi:hypothetical protein